LRLGILLEKVLEILVGRKVRLFHGKLRAGGELLLEFIRASAGWELKIRGGLGKVSGEEAVGRKL
jgi:hypothetical protein